MSLNNDTFLHLITFLDLGDLHNFCSGNKQFYQYCNDNKVFIAKYFLMLIIQMGMKYINSTLVINLFNAKDV